MSWFRLDDGFTANAKIGQLSDVEFRVWMRLLCHCAKSKDPSVDRVAMREVAGLTRARVSRYAMVGLLDSVGASFEVHDWMKYLPRDATNADRQAAWRARRNSSRNSSAVTKTQPRTRARAESRPVPSPSPKAVVPLDAARREQPPDFRLPDLKEMP